MIPRGAASIFSRTLPRVHCARRNAISLGSRFGNSSAVPSCPPISVCIACTRTVDQLIEVSGAIRLRRKFLGNNDAETDKTGILSTTAFGITCSATPVDNGTLLGVVAGLAFLDDERDTANAAVALVLPQVRLLCVQGDAEIR
jgi:hypothetical protein